MRALIARLGDDRCSGDDGAALVVVVLVLFTLIAFAAIAVDTAALVQERRTLQNGADAAARAVAQDCLEKDTAVTPGGCTLPEAQLTARRYAQENADDAKAAVANNGICASGTHLPTGIPCSPAPVLPANTKGHVRVTTQTGDGAIVGQVPFNFGRFTGSSGATVSRKATVAWGTPTSMTTLPVAVHQCEYNRLTDYGKALHHPPPYTAAEQSLLLYNWQKPVYKQQNAGTCTTFPDYLEPAGWTWIAETGTCEATTNLYDPLVATDPPLGYPDDCAEARFTDVIDKVIPVPVYDCVGPTACWIAGYSAFYLTGYAIYLAGAEWPFYWQPWYRPNVCLPSSTTPTGTTTCAFGFFVNNPISSEESFGSGPDFGFNLVKFVE